MDNTSGKDDQPHVNISGFEIQDINEYILGTVSNISHVKDNVFRSTNSINDNPAYPDVDITNVRVCNMFNLNVDATTGKHMLSQMFRTAHVDFVKNQLNTPVWKLISLFSYCINNNIDPIIVSYIANDLSYTLYSSCFLHTSSIVSMLNDDLFFVQFYKNANFDVIEVLRDIDRPPTYSTTKNINKQSISRLIFIYSLFYWKPKPTPSHDNTMMSMLFRQKILAGLSKQGIYVTIPDTPDTPDTADTIFNLANLEQFDFYSKHLSEDEVQNTMKHYFYKQLDVDTNRNNTTLFIPPGLILCTNDKKTNQNMESHNLWWFFYHLYTKSNQVE